jgi:phage terminase Nu1 subunit (DNA packaging protein)
MATQRALAVHLALSVSRIRQLQYAGVIKKDASLDCARLAYLRWLRERISSKSNSDINNERARLVYHQANLAALEEETRRSKLIPADDIAKEWEEIVSTIKSKMLTLPKAASNICLGVTNYQEMEHILKALVHDALDHLSNTNR